MFILRNGVLMMSIIDELVELEECPLCGKEAVLNSIGIFSKIPICSCCRQDEELCDFLGILPGGVVSG